MAITYSTSNGRSAYGTVSSFATTTGIAVALGDIIVVVGNWSNATQLCSSITDSVGNTYVLRTHIVGTSTTVCGYCLSATVAGASVTFTTNYDSSAAATHQIMVSVYGSGGKTVTFEAGNTGTGYGTALATGSINTTGDDELTVCGFGLNSNQTHASQAIGGSAASVLTSPDTRIGQFYRILTGAASGITGTATLGGSVTWRAELLSFKAESSETNILMMSMMP